MLGDHGYQVLECKSSRTMTKVLSFRAFHLGTEYMTL